MEPHSRGTLSQAARCCSERVGQTGNRRTDHVFDYFAGIRQLVHGICKRHFGESSVAFPVNAKLPACRRNFAEAVPVEMPVFSPRTDVPRTVSTNQVGRDKCRTSPAMLRTYGDDDFEETAVRVVNGQTETVIRNSGTHLVETNGAPAVLSQHFTL
jgi:hypothetical protein